MKQLGSQRNLTADQQTEIDLRESMEILVANA